MSGISWKTVGVTIVVMMFVIPFFMKKVGGAAG